MDRRNFLSWVGVGLLASSLPTVLAACASDGSSSSNNASSSSEKEKDAGGFKAVGAIAQLDKEGKLASDGVLVVRNPQDPKLLLAVNPTCPHKACTVEWKSDRKEFVCPCHKSTFSATGAVIQGPAEKPLPIYATKIEQGQVLVKI
jgi:cytochrome b6-f complex iron-sulfur subunit